MKISVSNIAWETPMMKEYLALLRDEGCQGLEFCPSMLWKEPITASTDEVRAFDKLVRSYGLEFASMHSLTFPHPQFNFFEPQSRKEMVSYIVELSKLANALKIPVMVFGGKSRKIGERNREECLRGIAETCREMAEKIAGSGTVLLIEPLSRADVDCLNNIPEGMELVRKVNHKHFGLHIDMKSSFAEKENQDEIWSKYGAYIQHCHISDPALKPPSANCQEHFSAGKAIKKSAYDRYLSLEVTRISQPVLKESIKFVRDVYER